MFSLCIIAETRTIVSVSSSELFIVIVDFFAEPESSTSQTTQNYALIKEKRTCVDKLGQNIAHVKVGKLEQRNGGLFSQVSVPSSVFTMAIINNK